MLEAPRVRERRAMRWGRDEQSGRSWSSDGRDRVRVSEPTDPRATALAGFLRERAALFSLSADVNNSPHVAEAGMALLEAAAIAQDLRPMDPLLVGMSERGLFESMPNGGSRVVDSDELGRSLSRSILGKPRDGRRVLKDLLGALPPWRIS